MRRYSHDQLTQAVAASRSWREVLRTLGLSATSAAAIRSVRRHADSVGLDYSHFRGQRRWSDEQLADAVASSATWSQVTNALGLASGSAVTTVRGHALRLGLETGHLTSAHTGSGLASAPRLENLRRAGPLMAAAWFQLCGHEVSWPLEPARYDLVVSRGAAAERVQVKTTTMRAGASWLVRLTSSLGNERTSYDPDEIDHFFVIDGALDYYLIPVAAVGGLMAIQLSAYQAYRLQRDP